MTVLKLDFPDCLRREFPAEYEIAREATEAAIAATVGRDFRALERHSPSLVGFDWAGYLRLSMARMVRALRLLRERVPAGAHVVDFGSYFGNFALMASRAGYRTVAFDSYAEYGECLAPVCELMAARGIEVVSSGEEGHFPPALAGADALMLMGVIEHIPHTPRPLLEGIRGLIAPAGLLVLDTPNLAYLYKRQALMRGESVYAPVQAQYATEIPFEGHHREYTAAEMEWMLGAAGFEIVARDAFNYSLFGLAEVSGNDLENYRAMEADPSMREILFYGAVPRATAAKVVA
jgi:2-polyprenyl-3-methyl-5-hydroxy-6-metoxy-1,4-benzoquinol methylase